MSDAPLTHKHKAVDPLDFLATGRERCQGALFLTFTFDATFFEEEVLATVLPIESDPESAPEAFQAEGILRLQEAPVLVMADRRRYAGGRQLPYDLELVTLGRHFHPKLTLLLFADHARLVIGSGNLTPHGHGGNLETGVQRTLHYADDAILLDSVVRFVSHHLSPTGEAWQRFVDVYGQLVPERGNDASAASNFLHSFDGPLLEQFLARIPADSVVHRAGILAPFHQEDGAPQASSVFERLVAGVSERRRHRFTLDIGLSWEGNAVSVAPEPDDHEPPHPLAHMDQVWTWTDGDIGKETVSWFQPTAHEGHWFTCTDGRKRSSRLLYGEVRKRRCRLVQSAPVRGPEELLRRIAAQERTQVWLFPEVRKVDGRVFRQPLHAKMVFVATMAHGLARTHVLVGSPNASRLALLERAPAGNVEVALHLVLDGRFGLGQLCPDAVPFPLDALVFPRHEYPESTPAVRAVEGAIYDARSKLLEVAWVAGAPECTVSYPGVGGLLTLFDGQPTDEALKVTLELVPGNLELLAEVGPDKLQQRVPIAVRNLVELPGGVDPGPLSITELVEFHAGRYSVEGLARKREMQARMAGDGVDSGASGLTRLAPRDVFKALFSIAATLGHRDTTLGGFHRHIEGRTGLRELADGMLRAAEEGHWGPSEAWLYGQELCTALEALDFEGDPTGRAKGAKLDTFVKEFRASLQRLAPRGPAGVPLRSFYRGEW